MHFRPSLFRIYTKRYSFQMKNSQCNSTDFSAVYICLFLSLNFGRENRLKNIGVFEMFILGTVFEIFPFFFFFFLIYIFIIQNYPIYVQNISKKSKATIHFSIQGSYLTRKKNKKQFNLFFFVAELFFKTVRLGALKKNRKKTITILVYIHTLFIFLITLTLIIIFHFFSHLCTKINGVSLLHRCVSILFAAEQYFLYIFII